MNDLVSVIMSTYREREDHLRLAVESILRQTYTNIEYIIIVDDPNNSNLIRILKEYKESDSRVKLIINNKNMGASLSRNKGYNISTGSYIAIMDADDISRNDRIEIQYRYMKSHPKVGAIFSTTDIINEDNDIYKRNIRNINQNQIRSALQFGNVLANPTAFIRKSVINGSMLYRNISYAEDYDLWLRLLTDSVAIDEIEHPLLSYRVRKDSLSHANYAKVWAGTQYCRSLYKQRKRNKNDLYSDNNFAKYLSKSVARNEIRMSRFNKSYNLYVEGIECINSHSYAKALKQLMKSVIVDMEIVKVIFLAYKTKRCLK